MKKFNFHKIEKNNLIELFKLLDGKNKNEVFGKFKVRLFLRKIFRLGRSFIFV